jgi:hypothetical protein
MELISLVVSFILSISDSSVYANWMFSGHALNCDPATTNLITDCLAKHQDICQYTCLHCNQGMCSNYDPCTCMIGSYFMNAYFSMIISGCKALLIAVAYFGEKNEDPTDKTDKYIHIGFKLIHIVMISVLAHFYGTGCGSTCKFDSVPYEANLGLQIVLILFHAFTAAFFWFAQ